METGFDQIEGKWEALEFSEFSDGTFAWIQGWGYEFEPSGVLTVLTYHNEKYPIEGISKNPFKRRKGSYRIKDGLLVIEVPGDPVATVSFPPKVNAISPDFGLDNAFTLRKVSQFLYE